MSYVLFSTISIINNNKIGIDDTPHSNTLGQHTYRLFGFESSNQRCSRDPPVRDRSNQARDVQISSRDEKVRDETETSNTRDETRRDQDLQHSTRRDRDLQHSRRDETETSNTRDETRSRPPTLKTRCDRDLQHSRRDEIKTETFAHKSAIPSISLEIGILINFTQFMFITKLMFNVAIVIRLHNTINILANSFKAADGYAYKLSFHYSS